MTFKSFCYEVWLEYMEECLCYNIPASPYKDWVRLNKWYLRKMYRAKHGNLQEAWKPDYERNLSPNIFANTSSSTSAD